MQTFDFAIVGAGMAGASLAAELAPYAAVLLLEAEDQPGYHATGRSAAFWEECYGGPDVTPLTQASREYLSRHGFLSRRGALYIGRRSDAAQLDQFIATFRPKGVELDRLSSVEIALRSGGLRSQWCEGVWQPHCADIDVGGLHAHYLAHAKANTAQVVTNARICAASHTKSGWILQSETGRQFRCMRLINAGGAWADTVAQLAGIQPLGVTSYRRTVAQLRTNPSAARQMPLILDISGTFYFKPEGGKVWLSPHDEVQSVPCDAAPEELAVAESIARFQEVVDWNIEAVETKWAGLRSFAPDRLPVYGVDPVNPDFIWFAGQGGFGIQTAPAAASLLASQLLQREPSMALPGINPATYSPIRFG